MKYWTCPQGSNCGPVLLKAKKESQTYRLGVGGMEQLQNICNHLITFSLDGGINDILTLHIKSYQPKTRIEFAVGTAYNSVKGEFIENLENKIIQVGYPFSLYLSVEHDTWEQSGVFEFEFWYEDNEISEIDKAIYGYKIFEK